MIDCPNVEMRDRLPDLANETLEPSVRALVLAHVESCVACTQEIEIIRTTRLLMVMSTPKVNVANIMMALPSYDSLPRAERGVSALPQHGVVPITAARSVRRTSWASWRAAAAITVLVAGVGSYAVLRPDSPVATMDSTGIVVAQGNSGLALTGALTDLSDAELSALVEDIEKIEALPSADVETARVIAAPALADSVARELENY